MKTLFNYLIITGLLLGLSGGCDKMKKKATAPGRNMRGGIVNVEVKVIKPARLDNVIQTTGTILANEKSDLKPEVSGRITDIRFAEGAMVEKGKLLLKINDADLQAQLKRNQALEKQLSDDEFRQRKLFEIKAISQEEYDATVNQLNIVRADKQLLQAQIAKTEIYAPFSGKIGLRNVSPGNFVVSNTIIATLQQINPVKLEFDVPEKHGSLIRNGQEVSFSIENIDSVFTGKIFASESGIAAETRSLKVRALCPNNGLILIPGAFARVTIVLETFSDALMVPTEAILTEMAKKMVYICKNGKAQLHEVNTGIRNETEVQITSGLMPGDSLIVSGLMQINNGSAVKVSKPQQVVSVPAQN